MKRLNQVQNPTRPLLIMLVGFIMMMAVDPIANSTGINKEIFVYSSLAIIVLTLVYVYGNKKENPNHWGAMQYPQLILGMLAIFIYVGVEVTIQSNLGALLHMPGFWRLTGVGHPAVHFFVLGKYDDWPLDWCCECF